MFAVPLININVQLLIQMVLRIKGAVVLKTILNDTFRKILVN